MEKEQEQAPQAGPVELKQHEQYPDDHPLVTALARQKDTIATLKQQLAAVPVAAQSEGQSKPAAPVEELELQQRLKSYLDRVEAAEKALAAREAEQSVEAAKGDVAKAKGLSADILRGSTKEELEAHADQLIAAGIKAVPAPSSEGQGPGISVPSTGELSTSDVVTKALGR